MVLLLAVLIVFNGTVFTETVTASVENNEISGYDCTRALFIKMLWLAEGSPRVFQSTDFGFSDISNSENYNMAAIWAKNKGIITEVSDSTFNPYKLLTRSQAAVILWKSAAKPSISNTDRFSDRDGLSNDERNAINWVLDQGIMSNFSYGQFHPEQVCTTQTAVIAIFNYMNLLNKNHLKNKTVVLIGDSDANGSKADGEGWVYWMEKHLNCQIVASYVGGAGFTKKGYGGGNAYGMNFSELLKDAAGKCVSSEVAKVIICGGYNDYSFYRDYGKKALQEYVEDTLKWAEKLFPYADVYLFPLFTDLPFSGSYLISSGTYAGQYFSSSSRDILVENIEAVYGIFRDIKANTTHDFIPLFQGGRDSNGVCDLCVGDGTHINSAGSEEIALMLAIYANANSLEQEFTVFPDVSDPSQPYLVPAYWAADKGIVQGYTDGCFRPDDSCTRQQFVVMIWRMNGRPSASSDVLFSDIDRSMSTYRAIQWAAEKGIITGYNDGTFRPDDTVTRQQVAIMLWRMAGSRLVENSMSFLDVNNSTPGFRAINWGTYAGLIRGYEDNTFRPADDCLRKQIVTFLYRYSKNMI